MKVLGSGKTQPSVRRTRCFVPLSMTLRGYMRFQRLSFHVLHPRDFSVAASRLARNDSSLANVVLRSTATKNLVRGKEFPLFKERNATLLLSIIFHYIDHD